MIDDPVHYKNKTPHEIIAVYSRSQSVIDNPNDLIFFSTRNPVVGDALLLVTGGDISRAMEEKRVRAMKAGFFIHGAKNSMTYNLFSDERILLEKSEWFDIVSVKYPDHFEWLLFHPEWI